MKKNLIVAILLFISGNNVFSQSGYVDLIGTGEDQFTFIPPPAQFNSGLRSASFAITFHTFTPEAQTAFEYATDIWGSILVSNIPIKVNTYFTPLFVPGLLGITLPNGRKNFPNAPLANIWYSTALANALADSEVNIGENDVDLFLNSSISWYFGTDGNCPAGKYDFVSIVLHELCHGLGFVSLGKVEAGVGSFGLLVASDFPGLVTSFPWPDLDTLPSAFDLHLQEYQGGSLPSDSNPSAGLAIQFTSNSVWFYGDSSQAVDPLRPKMYAPSTFSLGSSLLHLNESTYPAGNIDELMTPFSGTAEAAHDPGPVTIGILKDIGWNVTYPVGVEEVNTPDASVNVVPNPVRDQFAIYLTHPIEMIEISDISGRIFLVKRDPKFPLDVSEFEDGMYLFRVESNQKLERGVFIKSKN